MTSITGPVLADWLILTDPAWMLVATPTLADPGRAPAGQHTVKILTPQSYRLPPGMGDWAAVKQEHARSLLHVRAGSRIARRLLLGRLIGAQQPCGLTDLAEIAQRLGGFRTGQQARIIDAAGAGALELGQQRAAGVGGELGVGARPEAEPMQRQHRVRLRILRISSHGDLSLFPPQQQVAHVSDTIDSQHRKLSPESCLQ